MAFEIFKPFKEKLLCFQSDRHGGVSQAPYDTLNLALHVGDNPKNGIENRVLLSQKAGFEIKNLIYMDQVHSNHIEVIEHAMVNKIDSCDGVLTKETNIPLLVMVADCIPIVFYDPVKHIVGVAHAGRNGTFQKIATQIVERMRDEFGSNPKDLLVAMGTSIHSCCYEVGEEIVSIVTANFGDKYLEIRDGRYYLDLQTMNLDQLLEAGVLREHIEISSVCSCCDKNYFSYRRDGITGRFGIVAMLR